MPKYSTSKRYRKTLEALRREDIDPMVVWGDEYEYRVAHGLPVEDVPYGEFKKHFKFGNRKIGGEVGVFNIGSAKECPSKARGMCKVCKECYAYNAERQYGTPMLYRGRQKRLWDVMSPEQFAEYTARSFEKKGRRK